MKREHQTILKEFNQYLLSHTKAKSERSRGKYLECVEQMLSYFGDKDPRELSQVNADEYNEYLCKTYKQNSRVPHAVAVNHFFKMIGEQNLESLKHQLMNQKINSVEYMILKEKCNINIPVPSKIKIVHKTLTDREIRKIIETARNDPFSYALLYVFAETIQRESDVRDIDLDDVNFEKLTISFKEIKGGKPHKTNISKQCAEAIRHYIASTRLKPTDGSNALFVSTKGNRVSKGMVYQRIKEYGAKVVGTKKKVFPHLFRISGITNMDEAGVSPRVGMEISGHKDEKTYLGYIHPERKRVRKEFDRTLGNGNSHSSESSRNPIERNTIQTESSTEGNYTNNAESPESILTRALVNKEMTTQEYEKALAILMKYRGQSDSLGYIG
jgi:integrase